MGKYGLSSKCKECTTLICADYYDNNRDKILENSNSVVICPECQGSYTKANKSNHLKTIKHKKVVEELDNMIFNNVFI
jgi:Zn finger protein HypA/HybF involved in hydrogenase expression